MSQKTYSNSITVARVVDGLSADSLLIETNYESILRFESEDSTVFLPEIFNFKVLNIKSTYVPNFPWAIYFLDSNGAYQEIANSAMDKDELKNKYGLVASLSVAEKDSQGTEKSPVKDPEKIYVWYWIFSHFYHQLKDINNGAELKKLIDNGNVLFKFVYKGTDEIPKAIKYIPVNMGISADAAKMFIEMNKIAMAVGDSTLEFSSNGLTVANGAFRILKYVYEAVDINGETEFSEKPELYYIDNNHNYKKATKYEANTTYYIRTTETKLNVDEFGDLTLDGNGVFHGDVYANNGSFQGTIVATEGEIGGFTIENTENNQRLFSENKNIVLDAKNGLIIAKNIELGDGAKVTDQLVLADYTKVVIENEEDFNTLRQEGNKVYIRDDANDRYEEITVYEETKQDYYISQIACALYNPDKHGGNILAASNVTLTREGRLWLGTLELYGGTGNQDGYIRSARYDANSQLQTGEWIVCEDGTASFNNIYVDNAHINNAIVENESIQAIGGAMIFNDSWAIKDIKQTDPRFIYFDEQTSLLPGEYIYSGDNIYKVKEVATEANSENRWEVELHSGYQPEDKMFITRFGYGGGIDYIEAKETSRLPGRFYYTKDENGQYDPYTNLDFVSGQTYYYLEATSSKDCIISIQGNSKKLSNGFSSPTSLTISGFVLDDTDTNILYTKHLILGDLKNSGLDDLSDIDGYGLYADNVYLNGSLVTKANDLGSYAGINTLGGAQFDNELSADTSPIIFWGGADSKAAINEASFQVTAQGTLYAQNAIIENSTFVGGTLEAATIKTGIIQGRDDGEGELKIRDAKKGVRFEKKNDDDDDNDDNNYEELFYIGSNGIQKDIGGGVTLDFMSIKDEGYPVFSGIFQVKEKDNTLNLKISGDKIQFLANDGHIVGQLTQKHDIESNTNYIPQIILSVGESADEQFVFKKDSFTTKVEGRFDTDVFYGKKSDSSTYTIEQRMVSNGADIYIY